MIVKRVNITRLFNINMTKVELLAPAGSYKSFIGALNAGADAFYLAGNRFGARAYADNFTDEELLDVIKTAHLFGKKVYLTVNTLVKEKEKKDIIPFLQPLSDAGLDGVIVQDLGVLNIIKNNFPALPIHASTQMSITGEYATRLLQANGVRRIVPARELSLKEIKHIKDTTGVEIESFIHGAMCYSYSGMCLFSSILGGRSGNRGRCAQPCRLEYGRHGQSKVYPLSMKDMCTISMIPKLIENGIDSFKIEGRMKKPEYAAGVTSIYRKYIDKYYAGESTEVSDEDMRFLTNLYIRAERSEGYYNKHNGKDMITLSKPGYSGADDEVLEFIIKEYIDNKPTIPINIDAKFKLNVPAVVAMKYKDITVSAVGNIVAEAVNAPMDEEKIKKQLIKLGDTFFDCNSISIDCDDDIFFSIKELNELRRDCALKLKEEIIKWNMEYMYQS